jgi:hypothetical protein
MHCGLDFGAGSSQFPPIERSFPTSCCATPWGWLILHWALLAAVGAVVPWGTGEKKRTPFAPAPAGIGRSGFFMFIVPDIEIDSERKMASLMVKC